MRFKHWMKVFCYIYRMRLRHPWISMQPINIYGEYLGWNRILYGEKENK